MVLSASTMRTATRQRCFPCAVSLGSWIDEGLNVCNTSLWISMKPRRRAAQRPVKIRLTFASVHGTTVVFVLFMSSILQSVDRKYFKQNQAGASSRAAYQC